jgi:hypothetical protein
MNEHHPQSFLFLFSSCLISHPQKSALEKYKTILADGNSEKVAEWNGKSLAALWNFIQNLGDGLAIACSTFPAQNNCRQDPKFWIRTSEPEVRFFVTAKKCEDSGKEVCGAKPHQMATCDPLKIVALCSSELSVPIFKPLTLPSIHLTWRSPKTVNLDMASIIKPTGFLRTGWLLFEARAVLRFSSNPSYRVTLQRPLLGKKATARKFEFFHYIHV